MPLDLSLTEERRDCYQELANVSMGQAANKLARLLDAYIILPVPIVKLIQLSELQDTIQNVTSANEKPQVAVCQGFTGSGIAGEAMLVFNEPSLTDLATLLGHENALSSNIKNEVLLDISSLLVGACVQGLGNQLDIRFNQSPPVFLGETYAIEELIKPGTKDWSQTLSVEIHYSIEHLNVHCDLLLLFTEASVLTLNKKIDHLLD